MRSDRDCQWRHWVYFVYWPACWVLEDDTVMRYRRIYEYSRGHPWATSSIFPRFLQTVPQLRFFISKQGHLSSHLLGIFLDRSSWSSLRMEACHSLIYNSHSNALGSIETHRNPTNLKQGNQRRTTLFNWSAPCQLAGGSWCDHTAIIEQARHTYRLGPSAGRENVWFLASGQSSTGERPVNRGSHIINYALHSRLRNSPQTYSDAL